MDERTRRALESGRTIDITTTGRTTGTPGSRGWYANLRAHPEFTFHLKDTVRADLRARATPVLTPEPRRTTLSRILRRLGHAADLEIWVLEIWVLESPLVEVEILERE